MFVKHRITHFFFFFRFYKHIIGKSGSNINRIRNDTGVLINISEADGNNLIRLEGSPVGVAQAKKVGYLKKFFIVKSVVRTSLTAQVLSVGK